MRFAEPEYLWLLLMVPALALAGWIAAGRRRRALERFSGGPALRSRFDGQVSRNRRAVKALLLHVSIGAIPLALARPQWGTRLEPVESRGADIVAVLDTSLSMAAEDLPPSRLEHARQSIDAVFARVEGDRVALVNFAGQAALSCPLTVDRAAVRLFLDAADLRSVPLGGTALADALRLALATLERAGGEGTGGERGRAVLLYTDGEDHQGGLDEVIEDLRRAGVPVYVVGAGTVRGAPIPLRDGSGTLLGYKKDRQDKVVTSRLEEAALERLALETSGRYFRATPGQVEVERIAEALGALAAGDLGTELRAHYEDRFQLPLGLGWLALVVETLLGDRRRQAAAAAARGGE